MKNEVLVGIILGIVILVLLFGGIGFGYGGYGGMMGMMYGYFGSGMMIFGWLYGILIVVALILLIVWLAKQIKK